MKRCPFSLCLLLLLTLLQGSPALAISTQDILRLKQAGIREKTLQLIMQEKVIETCAFTVDDIISLKQAGISDQTLDQMIQQGSFMKQSGEVVYGEDTRSLRGLRVSDITKLKAAGVSDEVINTLIRQTGSGASDEDRQKAWDMLQGMGIFMDDRRPVPR